MQPRLTLLRLHQAAAFSFALMLAGLFLLNTHPALFQLGLAGFTLAALTAGLRFPQQANRPLTPVVLAFGGLFLLHLLAGLRLPLQNRLLVGQDLQLQLPLLLVPLGFRLLPPWPARWVRRLWLLFVGLVVLSSLGSTVYYLLHQESLNLAYTRSQIMPTRPDYVRFSLMLSLATAYCAVAAWQEQSAAPSPSPFPGGEGELVSKSSFSSTNNSSLELETSSPSPPGKGLGDGATGRTSQQNATALPKASKWRTLLLVTGFWLLFFQHLLAVRSGLLATYALGMLAVAWLLWKPKAIRPAAALLAVLLVLPLLSYWFVPTFRFRFHNTTYDVSRAADVKSANNYSMVGRVYSWKVARTVIAEHPWVGVGPANLPAALAAVYRHKFPAIEAAAYLKPHNQGLYWLVSFGLLGTLAAAAAFYYPLLRHWRRPPPLLLAQYVVLSLSFLVEPTLETPVGLPFAVLFVLLAGRAEERI